MFNRFFRWLYKITGEYPRESKGFTDIYLEKSAREKIEEGTPVIFNFSGNIIRINKGRK